MISSYDRSLIRLHPRESTTYINRNRTVLATDNNGFIADRADIGLFVHQTRFLSRYRYLIDGQPFDPVAHSPVSPHSWLGYYIALPPGFKPGQPDTGSGQVPPASQQSLELKLFRTVGPGLREEVELTNFSQQPTSFQLDLQVDADFADAEETAGPRRQKGRTSWKWKKRNNVEWDLSADYRARHRYDVQGNRGTATLWRGFSLRIQPDSGTPTYKSNLLSIAVMLAPQATWHMRVELVPHLEGKVLPSQGFDAKREEFFKEASTFHTPGSRTFGPVVCDMLERAKYDIASLRLHDLDIDGQGWTMAAGLPIYVALFGRDTLTASWQAALLHPSMMRGTLIRLSQLQGREVNDWRDEDPGRMLHEAHTGPLATLNYTPRQRYYGAATTSGFYPVIVSELWHWTGNKDAIYPLLKPALDSLRWLDTYADFDKDGFYEYKTRSKVGTANQGWKDSGDAIVYEDGTQVKAPIATCEEQAFVYAAKLQMSEVLWWFGQKDEAKRLYHEAAELKKRFNEKFWMDDEGFFAMGLDSKKRQIKSIGSNPGHCVASAIVDKSLVQKTVSRLFGPDLFSGWGIRTLSANHPAYNPYSYHRGSVWPVEQASFGIGFMRYGLHEPLHWLSRAQFEAALLFDYGRLPELFSGHARDDQHPFPALYPNLNWPQAWSSSTVFCFLQAILGIYPYAPMKMLLVDPHLPAWLPEITIENLQVGMAKVDLRFFRTPSGKSDYQILRLIGRLHVVRQPSPWSLTSGFAERVKDALVSLRPGK